MNLNLYDPRVHVIMVMYDDMFAGLQNDHKLLMREIEASLHQLHAVCREEKEGSDVKMDVEAASSPSVAPSPPFIKVDKVDAGSPAADAVSPDAHSVYHLFYVSKHSN